MVGKRSSDGGQEQGKRPRSNDEQGDSQSHSLEDDELKRSLQVSQFWLRVVPQAVLSLCFKITFQNDLVYYYTTVAKFKIQTKIETRSCWWFVLVASALKGR